MIFFVYGHFYPKGRKAPDFRRLQAGDIRSLKRSLLLVDVLLNDAQGRPTTTGGKVRRRPQDIVAIALLQIRSHTKAGTHRTLGSDWRETGRSTPQKASTESDMIKASHEIL
jgi:hypothetical protein